MLTVVVLLMWLFLLYGVLVCSRCCDRLPPTRGLKQQVVISHGSRGSSPGSGCSQFWSLPGFSLHPELAESPDRSSVSPVSSHEDTNPITRAPPS